MVEGSLRLVREFVNTLDVEGGTEALAGPDDLGDWLRDNDLLGAGEAVTGADLGRAIALREAVRELLAANHDGAPAADGALATLNTAARRARLRPEFTAAGTVRLAPAASGVDRAVGGLLVVIAEAMRDGRWRRLKVCHNDACRWAFFDASRSGAGKWCSMAVCGNRSKAAAWRTRHRDRR
ncbi:CGNR zinc finger domain-containing protein [Actinophytocola sp.]|uniref:CGNR zinc finger domain-containing protein n=1 Tax=Actinophytocola sp. TaxID=1872138 RepID=UPI002DDD5BAA|nr:ABATE domain-containing protein [Actinophytocola sp.]